jgi:arylsulfatase A-like enzyme
LFLTGFIFITWGLVSAAQNYPNIILIMADDLGYGDVGFNGNEIIRTPELDEIAANGLVFDRFYSAAPICSPTRGSCLTGRHPFRYGILAAHSGGMRNGEITIAEVLKENGYKTGIFGKWHLGYVRPDTEQGNRGYYSPPWHHGFDVSFVTKSAVPTWNPSITPPGWNAWNNFEGEMWSSSMYVINGELVTENLKGDDSRVIMDRVIPFIEEAATQQKPFFTCIWFHTPHEPIVAGTEYKALYTEYSKKAQNFYGAVTAMDEQVGRLRAKLKELGIDKNTILWFTSDNGPSRHMVKP